MNQCLLRQIVVICLCAICGAAAGADVPAPPTTPLKSGASLALDSSPDLVPSPFRMWMEDVHRACPAPSGWYLRSNQNGWECRPEWEFQWVNDTTMRLGAVVMDPYFIISNKDQSVEFGGNGTDIYPDSTYQTSRTYNITSVHCAVTGYDLDYIEAVYHDNPAMPPAIYLHTRDSLDTQHAVYLVGDCNRWQYADTTVALRRDSLDAPFSGRVTLRGNTHDGACHWRLYQRPSMGIPWGQDPADPDRLVKWGTEEAVTYEGTYDMTFDPATGRYTLDAVMPEIDRLVVHPAYVTLVPELPDTVRVLSLNNSLIEWNQQDEIFNAMAAAMGRQATWQRHSLIGQTLQNHWEEAGEQSARALIASTPWTHIILQDWSNLSLTDIEGFRQNVRQWVDFIRQTCPNPDAVIILHQNQGYLSYFGDGSTWNYAEAVEETAANCWRVAAELGVTVCPTSMAFGYVAATDGEMAARMLYSDNTHPSPAGSYLDAAIEYATIFNEDPRNITYRPSLGSNLTHAQLLAAASKAHSEYADAVSHHAATVEFDAEWVDTYGLTYHVEDPITFTYRGRELEEGVYVYNPNIIHPSAEPVTLTCGEFTATSMVNVSGAGLLKPQKEITPVRPAAPLRPQICMNGTVATVSPAEPLTVRNAAGYVVTVATGGRIDLAPFPSGLYILTTPSGASLKFSR